MNFDLPKIAKRIRAKILKMVFEAGSGHLAGSLSSTDILVALYFGGFLESKDKFVLSAGHYCPAFYAVLAERGKIKEELLATLRQLGSSLQGHPHNQALPGIVLTSSGPLGQGLSQAAGMALAIKMDEENQHVFCLMSDAEQQEGQVWEAVMFSAKYQLDNLVAIVDKNGIQIDGFTSEIMPLGDLSLKYHSFGWEVFEIDGHRFEQILEALESAKKGEGKPTVIIARTIASKGVSFMEGKWEWHSGKLTREQLKQALKNF